MQKFFFLLLISGTFFLVGACSKANVDSTDKKDGQHSREETPNPALIDFVKTHRLTNFQSTTIGNAFDSYRYLSKKEWKAEQQGRSFKVDFLGWFDPSSLGNKDRHDGIKDKGLEVMFVVEPNGSFYVFMVSIIESKSDGQMYRNELTDSAAILAKIYANEKLSL